MSNRYEIVEEPDALEIVDDDEGVYHPDQSISDRGASIRSLEPIISGPIGLKTIFYDPRWSPNQRKCCLGVMGIVVIACFSILIALFVGLGRVLSHIAEHEALKATGLYMIPDLEQMNTATFYYLNNNASLPFYQSRYFDSLNQTYQDYDPKLQEDSAHWVDCGNGGDNDENHLCRFSNSVWENTPCHPNNFGYDANKPCLLFLFRKSAEWKPRLVDKKGGIGIHCEKLNGDKLAFNTYPKDGFPKYLFPQVSYEEEDEKYTSPVPAVMVSFDGLDNGASQSFEIKCGIDDSTIDPTSLEKFKGTKDIIFQFASGNPNFEI